MQRDCGKAWGISPVCPLRALCVPSRDHYSNATTVCACGFTTIAMEDTADGSCAHTPASIIHIAGFALMAAASLVWVMLFTRHVYGYRRGGYVKADTLAVTSVGVIASMNSVAVLCIVRVLRACIADRSVGNAVEVSQLN